jgi:hypothetical protein
MDQSWVKEWLVPVGAVILSVASVVVAILSRRDSRTSATAAVRSASASETSAEQAKKSADVAVRSYELQLRPHVIAVVGLRKKLTRVRGAPAAKDSGRNTVWLENRGTGPAYGIVADLNTGVIGQSGGTSHRGEVSALLSGAEEEIADLGLGLGRYEVWGTVRFRNAEEAVLVLQRERGKHTWRDATG